MAATRFYFPTTGAAAVSPSFTLGGSLWDHTASADRLAAVTTKISSTGANKSVVGTGSAGIDQLFRQYVSAPIQAQTISGTVKGQIAGLSETTGGSARPQIEILVVSNDGSTLRGVLFAGTVSFTGPVFSTSALQNRPMPNGGSQSVSSVVAQANDRIVFNIGARRSGSTSVDVTLNFGDTSSDLPEGETGNGCPWVEFSADILNPSVPASATVSNGTMTLTGQALAAGRVTGDASVGTQATLTLTGQDVVGRQAITAGMTKGDLTLAGQALSGASATATANVFTQATLTLEGQDAQANWDAPDSVILARALLTLTGKALSAANAESVAEILTGTLTMTGQDVTGRSAVGAIANQGVITLTGQNVSAAAILAAIINQGSLTLTGRGVAISSEARTSTMGRAQITFTGSLVVVRQGFSFYQVHII